MKIVVLIALMTMISVMASSQTKLRLTVGDSSMTATLVDNAATRELTEMLKKSELTVEMSDYGGFEKVGSLPQSLPTSNSQITTVAGDIMLYQGNQIVIFYGSNSWSYTRLGKIDGATVSNLRQFLGNGAITLTLALDSAAGIENVTADANKEEIIYDLNGRMITHKPLAPGIYIINGKKTIVRQ